MADNNMESFDLTIGQFPRYPKIMQKGFVNLVMTALIVAAAGAFYWAKSTGVITLPQQLPQPIQNIIQPQPSPTPTPQVDETANWKIYMDEDYGFSFKYPTTWVIQTGGNFTEYGSTARFYKDGEKIDSSYMAKRGNEQMTIDISNQDFDNLKKQTDLPEASIAGKRALNLSEGAYILIDKKKVLKIFRYPDDENYMDKIISTFKFLE